MDKRNTRQKLIPYLFLSPIFLFYLIFLVFPVIFSFYISLKNWDMLTPVSRAPFLGLQNYIYLFTKDTVFMRALYNTLIFALVTVPVTIVITLLVAVALQNTRLKGFWRLLFFLPVVTTPVAIGKVWVYLYHPTYGLLNYFLTLTGMGSRDWLLSPDQALSSVMITYIWMSVGTMLIIIMAALEGIPEMYYEAAKVDGASKTGSFWKITLPLLKPALLFVSVTGMIAAWQIFDLIVAMTAPRNGIPGGPLNSTQVISLYMYQTGFDFMRMGRASAMAYVLFVIVILISLLQLRILRKGGVESYE